MDRARGTVVFLRSEAELSSMRAMIRDLEYMDKLDDQTRVWANRARDLAHEFEDWVDLLALAMHAGGGGGGGSKPSSSSRRLLRWLPRGAHNLTTLPSRHFIAEKLQDLKQQVVELNGRLFMPQPKPKPIYRDPGDLVGLDGPIEEVASTVMDDAEKLQVQDLLELNDMRTIDSALVSPSAPKRINRSDLVGLDGPIEEVTSMVMDTGDDAELKIVSIVGMAGSGKTTLAKAVYSRLTLPEEHNCFKCRAFVSVGLNPDLRKTLVDMLSDLTNRKVDQDSTTGHLITRIRQILNKERYLILVDDLWGMEHWETLKGCFPAGKYLGSRIITTTRNTTLAKESGGSIYNIPLLSETDSRKLFLDRSFRGEDRCPWHLEHLLSQIISRCGGLPVALVALAYMLRDQSSVGEWERLTGSIWLSMLSHPRAELMKQILNLSYNDLPPHLRKCLLYLSIFPENYKVDTARLVRLWIAEQFIAQGEGPAADVEETARSYLNELIDRNMVQPLHVTHDGAPSHFKLHPMMRDFIVCKSMEENFATLVDDKNRFVSVNHNIIYRLSVQSSKPDQDLAREIGDMNLSHVRSITLFSKASTAPRLSDLSFVRVLDLEGCDGPVCLDGLNKLLLLRYLSLRGTDVSELPAAIWELRFLETLDVRSTKMKELPRSIGRLRETLTTLLFSSEGTLDSPTGTATRVAEDIQHCRRLENLATIDLREHNASFVNALGALNSLRLVTMIWSFQQCTDVSYCAAFMSSIQKWSKLKSLTMHCGLGSSMEFLGSLSYPPKLLEKFMVECGGFLSVPKWIQSLSFLSFLQISLCRLATDDLKILGDIPKLQLLILGLDFVPREAIEIEAPGFSELLRFSVNCPVPWLIFRTGAMPKLTHLQLEICSGSARKDSVPSGIGNLQRLKEVALLYNEKWCANSSSIRMTFDAVKRQVVKHCNPIDHILNDTKVDVQEKEIAWGETEIESEARFWISVRGKRPQPK